MDGLELLGPGISSWRGIVWMTWSPRMGEGGYSWYASMGSEERAGLYRVGERGREYLYLSPIFPGVARPKGHAEGLSDTVHVEARAMAV
jgi:hypothetical protein